VPGPCAPIIDDRNPYWYKFTCFQSGTLGFTIVPSNLGDDYDWQIFDITGRNPADVFTDPSLFLTCNWSGESGRTGAGTMGTSLVVCEGFGKNPWSQMASLVQGHTYLLLISHFTNSQSGYNLAFGGGTASITDTTPPRMSNLYANCDGTSLSVKLNKKMRCSSVTGAGTEFILSPANAVITSSIAVGCNPGFDTDSIVLRLDKPLPAGIYTVQIKKGSDGNTILDYCDAPIPDTNKLNVTVLPALPTPMDSIMPVACRPSTLSLVFRNPILCSSIAANGSDFTITGPSVLIISGASGTCSGGTTRVINIQLATPIQVNGMYTITLKQGSDGNTLFNECTKETPVGSSVMVRGYDTVNNTIHYSVGSSCVDDTLKVWHNGGNGVNSWVWKFNDGATSRRPDTSRVYNSGTMSVLLAVSNGVCRDSSTLSLDFNKNRVKAAFAAPTFVCPLDTAIFIDSSTGPVTTWFWNFGNGFTSDQKVPGPQMYPEQDYLQELTARLYVSSSNGCTDSTSKKITVPSNCYIAVPTAFTPNGDGLNDFLYPLNAYKAVDLDFTVYNRYGQLIWRTNDWTRKWDGRINGNPQASGVYVWHLVYTNSDNGKRIDLRGTTTLIR